MSTTRILLADDHRLFLDGLRPLLEQQASLEVLGEAMDGPSAVRLALELLPDLILMDVSMPHLNGVEATRRVLHEQPEIRVIMLSMHADRRFAQETLKAGALGYVLKDSGFEELMQAIRTVLRGQIHLSPRISDLVLKDYVHRDRRRAQNSSAFAVLSGRKREVLQLLAEGYSTRSIAARLNLSTKTVETHRKQLMDTLGLHSIAELTKYAIREGITSLD